MIDVRGTYYELYFDNQLEFTGDLAECQERMQQSLDDDLAEIFKVQLTEEKVA
tara:strand:+ start:630 stop:788 length:159 start_codon:yes stop_codon:yes gene_type:complete